MASQLIVLNDTVTLQNVFRVAGAATNPTTVTITVTDPAGTAAPYTWAAGDIGQVSTGIFSIDIVANAVGIWRYVWEGTGTAIDVADGAFTVVVAADRTLYCTTEELKTYLGSPAVGADLDTQLTMAANAASRSVDAFTGRRFWLDANATAQTFVPNGYYELELHDDIGSAAGLIVATDNDGDGVYETVWSDADWQLLPTTAPFASPEAEPWTCIRAVGSRTFPLIIPGIPRRMNRVQVTAKFGWPAVPAMVRQATLIKAARLFHRRNSPQGIAAFDEFGPVRINSGEDGDVVRLLTPYARADQVLIA